MDVDFDIICSEKTKLSADIGKCTDWSKASDHEVEIAMNKISDWMERFEKIEEKGWSVKRSTGSFCLDEQQMRASQELIAALGAELEAVIKDVKFEDEHRCLYSTSNSKTATVKFPTFGGGQEEDFFKFEKEVRKGFLTNKTRRYDQVGVLRDCLKNHAKTMIPASMEDIEEAWNVLKVVYGDAARLMKVKKANIAALGKMPRNESNATQLQRQVEWLLKLELNLQDIFDIGSQDINMERAAYSPDMIDNIVGMFGFDTQLELSKLDKSDTKVKLSEMFDHIVQMRNERQDLLGSQDISETPVEVDGDESIEDTDRDDTDGDASYDEYSDCGSGGGPGDDTEDDSSNDEYSDSGGGPSNDASDDDTEDDNSNDGCDKVDGYLAVLEVSSDMDGDLNTSLEPEYVQYYDSSGLASALLGHTLR